MRQKSKSLLPDQNIIANQQVILTWAHIQEKEPWAYDRIIIKTCSRDCWSSVDSDLILLHGVHSDVKSRLELRCQNYALGSRTLNT